VCVYVWGGGKKEQTNFFFYDWQKTTSILAITHTYTHTHQKNFVFAISSIFFTTKNVLEKK
jgi:hypothetical protein